MSRSSRSLRISLPVQLLAVIIVAVGFSGTGYSQTITTSSLPGGVVSTAYPPQALSVTGGTPPYTWSEVTQTSCSGGSCMPPGLSISASGSTGGIISGTPTTAGTFNFVIGVSDSANVTGTRSYQIVIATALSITTSSLPDGTLGAAYPIQSLRATGGTAPYSWSLLSGSLPPGITLTSAGTISGTPTSSGVFSFTVRSTDSSSPSLTKNADLTIRIPPVVTTSSLANGVVGTSYSQTVAAAATAASPITWSVSSGSLPTGLALSTGGAISGTPTAAGTFSFTVLATDSAGQTGSKALTILIQASLLITESSPLTTGAVGAFYSKTIATSGPTPSSWSVVAGTLPPGLSLSSTGTLSGVPTVAGTFRFTLQATGGDPVQTTPAKEFDIVITPSLSIITTSLPAATLSTAYKDAAGNTVSLGAAGGVAPYTWSLLSGTLPAGLSLSAAGVLSGTPTSLGTFSFTVQVADSLTPTAQQVSRSFAVNVGSPLTITTSSLPTGSVSVAYPDVTLTATSGVTPFTWSVSAGALPTGLALSSAGVITGTPTAAGTFNFTVAITDSSVPALTATRALSITINASGVPTALTFTTTSPLRAGAVGAFYSLVIATAGPTPSNWSVISGILPPGIALSATGTLSGTPTTAGTFTFTVQTTGGDPLQTARKEYALTINAALSITTAATLPNGIRTVAYKDASGSSVLLGASGGVAPYTWSLLSGTLPAGITLSAAGELSGTPTGLGTFVFTAQVSDSLTPSSQQANRSFSITVVNPLTITTSSLPSGSSSSPYPEVALSATSGTAPFVWAVTSGSLPTGLSLSSAGILSGTPSAAGTFNFTVGITDSSFPPQTAAKALTITIIASGVPSALTITTASPLPAGAVGTFYSLVISTAGPTASNWSIVSGILPPGITLSATGTLSGTPTTAGTFAFGVQTTGGDPLQTARKDFTVTINAALTITTSAVLPNAFRAVAYKDVAGNTVSLGAAGGVTPYIWNVLSGTLPPGITLSTAGVLSGAPTALGTFGFTAQVSDGLTPTAQQVSRTFSITVTNPLTISTSSLPTGTTGVQYPDVTLTATSGTAPFLWSVSSGSLPAGLALSTAGVISGTPTTAGTSTFTIMVTDGAFPPLTGSKSLTITILSTGVGTSLAITSSSPLRVGSVGAFYSLPITTSGPTPSSWSLASGILPPGVTLSSTGTLSGTPTAAGSFTFTIQATGGDPQQTARKDFTVTINPALTITTSSVPNATLSIPYKSSTGTDFTLNATGGVAPYAWTVAGGSLPPGLTLSAAGGLSGTPTSLGTFTFAIQVSDSLTPTPQQAGRNFAIIVGNSVTVTTTSMPNGSIGTDYSQALAVTGGLAPYSWSATGLRAGLSISREGTVSGKPTTAGTFSVDFALTDSTNPQQTGTKTLVLTVQSGISITTLPQLPPGVAGVFYSRQLGSSGPSPVTWSFVSGILPPGLTLAPTGSLTGVPAAGGGYTFTIQAAGGDPPQTTSREFRITIHNALSISTAPRLSDAIVATPYSATLTALGAMSPYTWTIVSGFLPAGLTLSETGVVSGTPTSPGTYSFTVRVSDTFTPKQEVTQTFLVTVTTAMRITTETLPNSIRDFSYNQKLAADGGTGPYVWVVSSGALPAGITLSSDGSLQGRPAQTGSSSFRITVTDSRGTTATRDFQIVVDPQVAPVSVSSFPATLSPTELSQVGLSLDAPHPSTLTGKLTLTFTPKAEVPSDDPMTQFSSGSRTADFTIPAGTTAAVFTSRIMLLTGTVAGTVRLTASFENGPQDVTVGTVDILATPPQMTNVSATRTAGGVNVLVTGYAPSRRITNVEFSFDVRTSAGLERVTLQRSVEADFGEWYRNPVSSAFGSSFSFVQAFTIDGDPRLIEGITVRLTNAQGTTSSAVTPN